MRTIKVDKAQLLDTLRANRERHSGIVEEAWQGYLREAQKHLLAQVERARKGLRQHFYFNLTVPSDHTEDYDRVIAMLEMDLNDTVELTMDEFARYVQDQWEWRQQWTVTNSAYTDVE